jgi:predicted RND superfamily exporter protein
MSSGLHHPFERFPRAALALTLLLALPLFRGGWRFELGDELRALLEGDRRNQASYEQVRRILGESEMAVVSLECPDLFSPAGIERVRQISDALARQPGVVQVQSLTHSVKPVRRGWSFEMVPLVPERGMTVAEAERLRAYCLGHPLVRNILVSADGQHTILLVTWEVPMLSRTGPEARDRSERGSMTRSASPPSRPLWLAEPRSGGDGPRGVNPDRAPGERELRAALDAALGPFRREGLRYRVLAVPLIASEIRTTLRRDLERFVPAAAVLVVGLLWATLRSWRLVGLALAGQAFALGLLPGLVVLCGVRLNVFLVLLFPLLTALHLTLVVHLFTAFRRALATAADVPAALESARRAVAKSAAFATLTTMVGLLSFTVGGLPSTREFGWIGVLGLGLVHAFTFGPTLALLRLWPPGRPAAGLPTARSAGSGPGCRSVGGGADWAQVWAEVLGRHRGRIMAAVLALAAVSVAGWSRIRTDLRPVEFLDRSSPTRQALEELDGVYGGINVVKVDFDTGQTNGVNGLTFLRFLERVRQFAETRPDLSAAHAYSQVQALMHQIWDQERPDSLRLPDHELLVGVFVLALRSYDLPFLDTLVDTGFRRAALVLRTRDLPAARYLALVREVEAFARDQRPPGVTVSAAEGLRSILEADRALLRNQATSAGLTAAAIGVLLAGLWRSWRLAGLALAVNALPVAVVFAVAGYARLPLNSVTVMVAALALGITVDNSIHFLTQWRDERRRGHDPTAAVAAALRTRGRAILGSTGLLVAVFALFWWASFPPVTHFGVLAALAFGLSLPAVGILLPALLTGASAAPGALAPIQRQRRPNDGEADLAGPGKGFAIEADPDQQAEGG